MISEWETEEERLKKHMKIPAKQKLEWLQQMHELVAKSSSKRMMKIRWKLREMRKKSK